MNMDEVLDALMAFDGERGIASNIHKPAVLSRVLEGDYRELWPAFSWDASPQAHAHWYERARGNIPLSTEDRTFLDRLRAAMSRRCQALPAFYETTDEGDNDMSIWSAKQLSEVLSGDHTKLWEAFHWDSTPQGHDHWYDRAEGREPISVEDRAFVEQLYAQSVRRRLLGSAGS